MDHRAGVLGALIAVVLAVSQSGCAAPIAREDVPTGWALDVHQPGAWWTQPLIPRSVVVQRCPPPAAWTSDPDLTTVTGLPPGSDVNYSFWGDDYHCRIGWSEPASEVSFTPEEMATEAGLRRICSSTGLPMDASWRFLGVKAAEEVGVLAGQDEAGLRAEFATAAFIDDQGTVVACLAQHHGEAGAGALVELSVGTATSADAPCPVTARDLRRNEDGTLDEYQVRGAGAVRDAAGRVLTEAKTLTIGVTGDTVTTSHPVVDGIAIVDAWVDPKASIHFDWEQPPTVQGTVHGADGTVLATCRA